MDHLAGGCARETGSGAGSLAERGREEKRAEEVEERCVCEEEGRERASGATAMGTKADILEDGRWRWRGKMAGGQMGDTRTNGGL